MKTKLAVLILAGFSVSAHCGELTAQEQALLNKGLFAERCDPSEHSGRHIETIHGSKGSGPALVVVFGQEDFERAKMAGQAMAAKGLTPDSAVQHLLAEANARYHGDKLFTKTFMDEAANAYNAQK
jgi:hypothetical protein